jgi:squalene synthase HpnC
VTPIAEAPGYAPSAEAVMARASGENFPVASHALPRRARAHLLAVYGFARLVDELGDAPLVDGAPGAQERTGEADRAAAVRQRLAALDWLEGELDRALRGAASHPLLVRLGSSARACGLRREPFVRLIEANRQDQRVSRYESWDELRGYCALSADPVGELVLGVLGLSTPARIALSDSICSALQLIEHCQDVAEDRARGRVYLPAEDLRRFGCEETELQAAHASGELRRVLAFELDRARTLLDDGAPLLAELHGRPRLAVAAFVAGGRAAAEAIERAGYDVLAGAPRAGRARRAAALASTLLGAGRAGASG